MTALISVTLAAAAMLWLLCWFDDWFDDWFDGGCV